MWLPGRHLYLQYKISLVHQTITGFYFVGGLLPLLKWDEACYLALSRPVGRLPSSRRRVGENCPPPPRWTSAPKPLSSPLSSPLLRPETPPECVSLFVRRPLPWPPPPCLTAPPAPVFPRPRTEPRTPSSLRSAPPTDATRRSVTADVVRRCSLRSSQRELLPSPPSPPRSPPRPPPVRSHCC